MTLCAALYPHQASLTLMLAQEAATHRPLADVSSSFSQTFETEKRRNRFGKIIEGTPSKILWTAQSPSANLGKPFIAEICGASAADEAHRNYPNAHAISRARPNTPTPAEVPSIAAQHPSHAAPPLNRPPPARPGRRTDRYRRDSPVAQPSPNPNPNSAAQVGGAGPYRHHTLILVCPRPAYEAATAHHTSGNAQSQSCQPHPINFGTKAL